jgi:hypothetical protein
MRDDPEEALLGDGKIAISVIEKDVVAGSRPLKTGSVRVE